MSYLQLDYEKRIKLQAIVNMKPKIYKNQEELAKIVWTSQSTISRELSRFKKNFCVLYDAKTADEFANHKRSKANDTVHTKILVWSETDNRIQFGLRQKRSCQQISWRLKEELGINISYNAIYRFVYEHYPNLIRLYFRRKWKKYRKSWAKKTKIPNRVSIHERPKEANDRVEIWHFEADTIVWKNTKDRITTYVDRMSRFLFADLNIKQNERWLAISTSTWMFFTLRKLANDRLKTITFDNWSEFTDHEYLMEMLWVKNYFTDPYSSRQKWLVEYKNSCLREFFPKQFDFKNITEENLKYAVDSINNRPMKCLWYKTPAEVFYWKTIKYIN